MLTESSSYAQSSNVNFCTEDGNIVISYVFSWNKKVNFYGSVICLIRSWMNDNW